MKELDIIVLTEDLPELDLKAGDLGTIVLAHARNAAFEVEFCTLDGMTVAVETLLPHQIRAINGGEIAHARKLPDLLHPN
ncbi:hypothetical protein GCM10010967_27270 [Dyadobacter beijingensis]|uniref:DUF4926 domain-containing protein n=1 Tax=Dyadobacter beijingensis TaxID=365489 RepID=A0ABQ2HXG2_9BACT|nr:DUF4926 domain-containing protein [Dyadobacter beijingensis]GGM92634.1 hypothetical protein GCM10010967_27270 [Dyadobacter beijingensis]